MTYKTRSDYKALPAAMKSAITRLVKSFPAWIVKAGEPVAFTDAHREQAKTLLAQFQTDIIGIVGDTIRIAGGVRSEFIADVMGDVFGNYVL